MWAMLRGAGSFKARALSGRGDSQRDFLDLGQLLAGEYSVRGVAVPAAVQREIEKRKADTEGKAKLNLAGCGLTDRDVLILVDVLVECRVISKLELRRNAITETGAQAVLTLLKEQQLFMQTNALADRAHCTFLAHVDLDSCNGAVSPGTLSAIKHLTEVLATCNAMTALGLSHADSGSPASIPLSTARAMFQNSVGKPLKDKRIPAGASSLSFEQVQALVLEKLVKEGVLVALSEEQRRLSEPLETRAPQLGQLGAPNETAAPCDETTRSSAVERELPFDGAAVDIAKWRSTDSSSPDSRPLGSVPKASSADSLSSPASARSSSASSLLRDGSLKEASPPAPFELDMCASDFLQRSCSSSRLSELSVSPPPSPPRPSDPLEEQGGNAHAREEPSEGKSARLDVSEVQSPRSRTLAFGRRLERENSERSMSAAKGRRLFDSHAKVPEPLRTAAPARADDGHSYVDDGGEGVGDDLGMARAPDDAIVFTAALPAIAPRAFALELACKRIYLLDEPVGFALGSIRTLDLSSNFLQTVHCTALNALPALQSLNLSRNLIRRIEGALLCSQLLHLDLSRNGLVDLRPLQGCASLRRLDVACNLVSDPTGLPVHLTHLDASDNRLAAPVCLRVLSVLAALRCVRLGGNPLELSLPNWRLRLRSLMPQLQEIDGKRVKLVKRGKHPEHSLLDMSSMSNQTKEQQEQRDRQRCDEYRLWQEARERAVGERDAAVLSALTPSKRLTPSAVQQLVGRLCLPIARKSPLGSGGGALTDSAAPSLAPAVRSYLGACEERKQRAASVVRSVSEACQGPVSSALRVDLCAALAGLQLDNLVSRGEALLAPSRATLASTLRRSLSLAVKQLKELHALISDIELALSTTRLSSGDLASKVEAAMASSRGQLVNASVLCHLDADYKSSELLSRESPQSINGEDDSEEGARSPTSSRDRRQSTQQRLTQRAQACSPSRGSPSASVEADSPLTVDEVSEEEDEEGVRFTDSVMRALRTRLSAISVQNGRAPDLDDGLLNGSEPLHIIASNVEYSREVLSIDQSHSPGASRVRESSVQTSPESIPLALTSESADDLSLRFECDELSGFDATSDVPEGGDYAPTVPSLDSSVDEHTQPPLPPPLHAPLHRGLPFESRAVDAVSSSRLEAKANTIDATGSSQENAARSLETDASDMLSMRSETASVSSALKTDDASAGGSASDKDKIRERILARMSNKKK